MFAALNLFAAGQGQPQLVFYAFLPAFIMNVLLNLLWIPTYDYLGAAAASSVSYALGSVLFFWVFILKYPGNIYSYFVPTYKDFRYIMARITGPLRKS